MRLLGSLIVKSQSAMARELRVWRQVGEVRGSWIGRIGTQIKVGRVVRVKAERQVWGYGSRSGHVCI